MRLIKNLLLVLGIVLLARMILDAGPAWLWAQLVRVGPAFGIVLAIVGAELAVESEALRRLISAGGDRPKFLPMLALNIGGSTIGGLMPGFQMGEFGKAGLMRGRIANDQIVSSLVLYNYVYMVTSAADALLIGVVTLGVHTRWAVACVIASAVTLVGLFGLRALLHAGLLGRLVRLLVRAGWKKAARFEATAAEVDVRLRTYRHEHPRDFAIASALLILARLLAGAEFVAIILALGAPVGWLTALFLFNVLQLGDWATQFIPQRTGLLEAGAAEAFKLFGYGSSLGLAAEIVRRLRKIAFTGIGMAFAASVIHGWPERPAARARPADV